MLLSFYPDFNYTVHEAQIYITVGDVFMPTCYNPFPTDVDLHLTCMGNYTSRQTSQVVTLDHNITVTQDMDGKDCRCAMEVNPNKRSEPILVQEVVKFEVFCKYLIFF